MQAILTSAGDRGYMVIVKDMTDGPLPYPEGTPYQVLGAILTGDGSLDYNFQPFITWMPTFIEAAQAFSKMVAVAALMYDPEEEFALAQEDDE
jgi:hypothetical protein